MNLIANLLLLLFLLLCTYTAESADPVHYICDDSSKQGSGSKISGNIEKLVPVLVSGTIRNGFIATAYGEGKDRIYGLAQCRGDVSKSDCSACIQDAAEQVRSLCPNQADSRIFYDYCFLRYDNTNFFDVVDTSGLLLYNVNNVTDPEVFNKKLSALMDRIDSEAVKPANKGLGKGESDISSFIRLYALVQCTRDLSEINCAQCLAIAISNFPTVCNNKRGCRVVYSSCYVRYEEYPFFFSLDGQQSLVDHHSSDKYVSVVVSKH